jgi:glucose/arabinose dehydrogenase
MQIAGFHRWIVPVVVALLLIAPRVEAQHSPPCARDNAGLTLSAGFCALVVADGLGRARHLVVAPNGDVFVAVTGGGNAAGDGVADVRRRFGGGTGNGIALDGGYLYYANNDAVMRYRLRPGALEAEGPPDTIVSGLPAGGNHRAKSIVIGADGGLYVNMGSASNACQRRDRVQGSPGEDPCEELERRAGIWRFDPTRAGQSEADGERFATGMRNTVALALRAQDGGLYGVIHGRDQLSQLWPAYFTDRQSAEEPGEELVRIARGDDYGWPYCYYDQEASMLVLAPEYGGDGKVVGRCASKKDPLLAFPGHWAPDGLLFYRGSQFPAAYRGGAFIAFHGSWNRAPLPQEGYDVVFVPFTGDLPGRRWSVFANGFARGDVSPGGAAHRPVGLAEGPDGSIYVSDDKGGTIFRILYVGGNR